MRVVVVVVVDVNVVLVVDVAVVADSTQECPRRAGRHGPRPGTSRTIQNIEISQKLCPERVWGPRLRNTCDKSEKNVLALRPRTFVSL